MPAFPPTPITFAPPSVDPGGVDVVQRDGRAFGRESAGDRLPDAARGAGDDRDLAGQFSSWCAHDVLFVLAGSNLRWTTIVFR
jgi:hypothetical protein